MNLQKQIESSKLLSNNQIASSVSQANQPILSQQQGKTNKSFASYFSSEQFPSSVPSLPSSASSKQNFPTSFTITIIEGRLGLANSSELRPFVQIVFRNSVWCTQLSRGSYPKWNEQNRFEIGQNSNENSEYNNQKSISTLGNNNQATTSSSLTLGTSSLNSILPGFGQSSQDYNVNAIVFHWCANENIEIGRVKLNILDEQAQEWLCLQNASGIVGSIQIQVQSEYFPQLQYNLNKHSHQTYLNFHSQLRQQRPQASAASFNQVSKNNTNIYSEDSQKKQEEQLQIVQQQQQILQQQSLFLRSQQCQQQIQQQHDQNSQQVMQPSQQQALGNYYYINNTLNSGKSISPNQMSVALSRSSQSASLNEIDLANIDQANKLLNLKKKNEQLIEREMNLAELLNNVKLDHTALQREKAKLDQTQGSIQIKEAEFKAKEEEKLLRQSEYESATASLEEKKKVLQKIAEEYLALLNEEKQIKESNLKIKEKTKVVQEQNKQIELNQKNHITLLNHLQGTRASSRLKMFNQLEEVKRLVLNEKNKNYQNLQNEPKLGQHKRVKSGQQDQKISSLNRNDRERSLSNNRDYTIQLKNVSIKIGDIRNTINLKNQEIESLREQINEIKDKFADDQ